MSVNQTRCPAPASIAITKGNGKTRLRRRGPHPFRLYLIGQTWVGIPTTESYRAGNLAALHLAEQHQLKQWLIDQRQLRMFRPEDLQWFIQEWLPLAVTRLTDNVTIALVLTDLNQFSKLGSDLALRAALALNPQLQSRYFTDMAEARTWLIARKSPVGAKPSFTFG